MSEKVDGEKEVKIVPVRDQVYRMLEYSIFCIESLAARLHMNPRDAYDMLTKRTDLLETYIIPSYDVLHTQDQEYIVNDILEALKTKGVIVA